MSDRDKHEHCYTPGKCRRCVSRFKRTRQKWEGRCEQCKRVFFYRTHQDKPKQCGGCIKPHYSQEYKQFRAYKKNLIAQFHTVFSDLRHHKVSPSFWDLWNEPKYAIILEHYEIEDDFMLPMHQKLFEEGRQVLALDEWMENVFTEEEYAHAVMQATPSTSTLQKQVNQLWNAMKQKREKYAKQHELLDGIIKEIEKTVSPLLTVYI